LDRGFRVRLLDSFVYGGEGLAGLEASPNLEILHGDICSPSDLDRAVRGARGVIALAALVGDAACDLSPERTMAVNYESTRETVRACKAAGVQRLVFASSCSVYGANGNNFLYEDSFKNPVSLYARTRVMSEELLQREQTPDFEVAILRLATVCGVSPRMRFDLMVNTMTACARSTGRIRVTGASQWRPHLHVQDAAEAFLLAVESPHAAGGIFNVGSDGENFTIAEVAEKVAAQNPGTVIEHGVNGTDARSYRVSFKRIREEIGFQSKYTVDDAIREVGELFASGAVSDFTGEQFHNAKWLSSTSRWQGAA
jgi:nucleoside-diphosphate-sugar epimerase